MWTPRKIGRAIGRIAAADPSEGDRYYLRLLLNHIRGATSFQSLMSVNGAIVSSFREAALMHELLHSDTDIADCLTKTSILQMPRALRRLFATILVYCNPANPRQLWVQFESSLSEDFYQNSTTSAMTIRIQVLRSIASTLESMGRNIGDFKLIDTSINLTHEEFASKEMADELSIPITPEDLHCVQSLNSEQRAAYNTILLCINQNVSGAFFIDGSGGTGKTYLYRALLSTIRSTGDIALATATSGVAASILPGGRTAHSRFKISIDPSEQLTCNVSKQSSLAKLLRAAKLIVWDEASMARREAIEALVRMLQDLTGCLLLFGGKVIVFGEDFRQVLPIVPRSTQDEAKDASFVNSTLWPQLKILTLTVNMRARLDPYFTKFLLRIGDGTEPVINQNLIHLPKDILPPYNGDSESSLNLLIDIVFPDIYAYNPTNYSIVDRAILTPKNDSVDEINEILISRFPGQTKVYTSRDESINLGKYNLDEDFFNTLIPNGYPPHRLVLKLRAPIILLRNIDPSKGLSNGTRLICREFDRNVIDVEIAIGHHKNDRVFISRIPILPNKVDKYPFPFKRIQFPIRLSFAMTINKVQGQTLRNVGIYLPQSVFSHGQLYVALSRAINQDNIKVLIKGPSEDINTEYTANIVHKDILQLAHPQ